MRSSTQPCFGKAGSPLLALCLCLTGCEGVLRESPRKAPVCDLDGAPVPGARLLTRSEYFRTARDLLGETEDPTAEFPHEPEVDGFDNNASSHRANPRLVEMLTRTAASLASRARNRGLSKLLPCSEKDAPCAAAFIAQFGGRAFRRPLTAAERATFERLYERLAPALGHDETIVAIIEATLQSPQFLYRVEAPRLGPESGTVALGPYELASRLSYFFWGTMPDDELLSAAAGGGLDAPSGVELEARRLLGDPRAKDRVREFVSSWLHLSPLDSVARDGAPDAVGSSLRTSLLSFTDEVFWSEGATVSDLLSSPAIYVDQTIAPLYSLTAPAAGFQRHEIPDKRRGLLTQPGLLTLLSNANQSSPIRRGVFVRERLLCAPVPPPPPTVDNSPPDPDSTLTTRERFSVHTQDPECAKCHQQIDPIGFSFEAFDQLGRYRSEENGLPIDTSGALVTSGDAAIDGPVSGAFELGERLANSPAVTSCLLDKWFTFAMGRPRTLADQCTQDEARGRLAAGAGDLREMLVALALSPAFRMRAPHPAEDSP